MHQTDGPIRDQGGLGSERTAREEQEDAQASTGQQARHRSPLSNQHRQNIPLASSSDDDDSDGSGGIGFDTADSALRDYMDNVLAEQDERRGN